MELGTIYCGDNLELLSRFPEKSVDLIYADPPFFSNKHYEVIWHDGAEIRAFEDRWKGGINQYIKWMRPRLAECHRVLKDTGSMYLHCDWHANAYLRILMDKIFGGDNFQNEIIWHYHWGIHIKKRWNRKHDTILFYSKSNKWFFTPEFAREPYSEGSIMTQDARWNKSYSQNGRLPEDVWYIPTINAIAKERLGYPTQKPEALLKRIMEASSNKGDIVLDPFCGCGTTIAVAQQLGRQWIGIDVSLTACKMMENRLNSIGAKANVINMPSTIEDLKTLKPFEFQNWVIRKINGTPSNRKTDDKGIDGWTFMHHEPVQVKQSNSAGRNVVDNFETAIKRAGYNKGFIYAFGFTKDAYEEVARAELEGGLNIELIKVEALCQQSILSAQTKNK